MKFYHKLSFFLFITLTSGANAAEFSLDINTEISPEIVPEESSTSPILQPGMFCVIPPVGKHSNKGDDSKEKRIDRETGITWTLVEKDQCPAAAESAVIAGCLSESNFQFSLDKHQALYCDSNNTSAVKTHSQCSFTSVPNMRDFSVPSGLVESSGTFMDGTLPQYAPWQAFNSNQNYWLSTPNQFPAWISYQWSDGIKRAVRRYSITFNNGDDFTERAPKSWLLQGYGESGWVNYDQQTNQIEWKGHEVREYTLPCIPGMFSRYRLLILEDNSKSKTPIETVSIGFLELFEDADPNEKEESNLIPILSSNSGENGLASSSGDYSGSQAYYAFDDSNPTKWLSTLWESPVWIQYEWGNDVSQKVTRYEILFTNGSLTSRAPRKWELQGAKGYGWVTLDTQNNQSNWAGTESRSFTVQSPDYYKKYRLLIHEDNDSRSDIVTVSISRLSLFGY